MDPLTLTVLPLRQRRPIFPWVETRHIVGLLHDQLEHYGALRGWNHGNGIVITIRRRLRANTWR